MAAFVSAGGSISWGGLSFTPRTITFKSAEAETTEIPYLYSGKNTPPLVVPTGDFRGGGISVQYTRDLGSAPPTDKVGLAAPFTYSDAMGYVLYGNNMLLVSCSDEVQTGSVVTGTLEFVLTSFSGNNWS